MRCKYEYLEDKWFREGLMVIKPSSVTVAVSKSFATYINADICLPSG